MRYRSSGRALAIAAAVAVAGTAAGGDCPGGAPFLDVLPPITDLDAFYPRIVTGDFDGDGLDDLVLTRDSFSGASATFHPALADGHFGPATSVMEDADFEAAAAADLNGDGSLDLVVAVDDISRGTLGVDTGTRIRRSLGC